MRILFLTQVLPYPLDSGPKIRAYYVLRWLAESGREVTLASFVRPDNTSDQVSHLKSLCREVHVVQMHRSRVKDAYFLAHSLIAGHSFIVTRDTAAAMQSLVAHLSSTQQFDVVHADQLWMAQYALRCNDVKRVLDQHNAVYLIPQRLAQYETNPLKRLLLEREWRSLLRHETQVCQRFDEVVTVTNEDMNLFLEHLGNSTDETSQSSRRFTVIPICLDPTERPLVTRHPEAKRILILGTMFWPPNAEGALWFGREALPLIVRECPEAVLTIIGKNPPPAVRKMAEASSGKIEITGYVENLTAYLEQGAVFAVPLRAGGGMRVKILDAWAWGLPIVSTTVGAEGIDARDGENILIADSVAAFARATINVIKDPALANRLRNNGRQWVEHRYNWRLIYSKWDEVYDRLHG